MSQNVCFRFRIPHSAFCILLVFGLEASADSPDLLIRQVTFKGNDYLNRKELAKLIGVRPGEPYQKSSVVEGLERILTKYRDAGYVFATVVPAVTHLPPNQVTIQVDIDEGSPLRISGIAIGGNTLFPTGNVRRELGIKPGQVFNPRLFEKGIGRVLALYSERGYPNAKVLLSDFQLSPASSAIELRLELDEGELVRIGEVKLTGLRKTKPEIVLRELPLQAGDVYDQRELDRSFRFLTNSGYFYEVDPVLLEPGDAPDEVVFNAKVTEARTGRFTGVLGYAPPTSEFEEAPTLTGLIQATETNLFGTGRQANVLWKSGLLNVLKVGYAEPWAFGKPIKIGVEYAQTRQRNQFTDAESKERAGSLSLNARFKRLLETGLAFSYKQIDLPAVDAAFPTQPIPTTSLNTPQSQEPAPLDQFERQAQSGVKYGVVFSLTRDSRDYFLNPTRGRRDHVAFEVSGGDFKMRKLWLDLQQYFPTWKRQVIAIGLHGAAAWGANIPPTELFFLGGAETLRGYDEDWFFGPRRVYANVEYRLLTGRNSQFFGFVDIGAVTEIDRPAIFQPFRVGYGVGLRLESRGGLLRLNYGLAEGNSVLEGKVHVNLGTTF